MTRALFICSLFGLSLLGGCGATQINPLVFDDLAPRPHMVVKRLSERSMQDVFRSRER